MKMQKAILIAAAVLAVCGGAFAAQNFERDEGWVLYSNTGAAIASGDIVNVGGRYGFAKVDIASNATGVVATRGVWQVTLATNENIAVGDKIYWASGTTQATETATADTLIGLAVESVSTVGTHTRGKVKVDLNAPLRAVVAGVDTAA
jgi:predicted RecA/RadA family phage recombinase